MSKAQGSVIGHIGYQQQFGWLVIGGEVGELASLSQQSATTIAPGAASGPCANLAGVACQASIDSTTLAGGKLGVDWGNWLFYGVGGSAFKSGIATLLTPGTSGAVFSSVGEPQSTHGWYAGGGIDYLLVKTSFGDVIGGVEYQHLSLNTVAQCAVTTGGAVGGCPGTVNTTARLVSATEDAVWAKLTLKFNAFGH